MSVRQEREKTDFDCNVGSGAFSSVEPGEETEAVRADSSAFSPRFPPRTNRSSEKKMENVNMRKTAVLLLTVLLAVHVFAQSSVPWNGTTWKATPDNMKDAYVLGYIHGAMRTAEELKGLVNVALRDKTQLADPRAQLVRANGLTPSSGEIRDAVDVFYSVPENLPVCMASAVDIEWLSLTGHPYDKSLLEAVRKVDGKNGCNSLPTLAQYADQVVADTKAEAAKPHQKQP